jgi:ATP-binding cassette subfamily G (WHITE) protein 2 (PDR)
MQVSFLPELLRFWLIRSDYQKTVGNLPLAMVNQVRDLVSNRKRKVQILNGVDGVLETGEMLVVLGPPGSGCTTLLKTIAGEQNGLYLDEKTEMNYRGELSLIASSRHC